MRIKLTDEDIELELKGLDTIKICYTSDIDLPQAEQLKKQILENQDKAEELDDLKKRFITTKNIVSTMETVQRNNTKLEQENKELKEILGREE